MCCRPTAVAPTLDDRDVLHDGPNTFPRSNLHRLHAAGNLAKHLRAPELQKFQVTAPLFRAHREEVLGDLHCHHQAQLGRTAVQNIDRRASRLDVPVKFAKPQWRVLDPDEVPGDRMTQIASGGVQDGVSVSPSDWFSFRRHCDYHQRSSVKPIYRYGLEPK